MRPDLRTVSFEGGHVREGHSLDVVEKTIDKGQRHKGVAKGLVGVDVISSRDNCPESEDDTGSDSRGKINRSTAENINEERKSRVDDQTLRLHTCIDTKLSLRLGDTNVVHDTLKIIRDQTVATPLTEETQSSDETNSLTVTRSLEEVDPGCLSDLFIEGDGGLDLAKLELDKFIIGVILCVVMSEDLEGFVVLILAEEPTGTLGHPKDSDEDDDAAYGLEKAGKSPGPVALNKGSVSK